MVSRYIRGYDDSFKDIDTYDVLQVYIKRNFHLVTVYWQLIRINTKLLYILQIVELHRSQKLPVNTTLVLFCHELGTQKYQRSEIKFVKGQVCWLSKKFIEHLYCLKKILSYRKIKDRRQILDLWLNNKGQVYLRDPCIGIQVSNVTFIFLLKQLPKYYT